MSADKRDIFVMYLSFADEWSELEKALVHFKFDERAEELKDKIDRFFELVERSKAEIWDESAPTSHVSDCLPKDSSNVS